MNEIEINLPKVAVFKPEKDDFIHISRVVSSAASYSRRAELVFHSFLVINAIFVPALLIYLDYWKIGLAIFIINILVVIYLVPMDQRKAETDYFREFYDDISGDERHEMELSEKGINYRCPGHGVFVAWDFITEIRESPDTLFFFTKHGGYPLRKSAFGSSDVEKGFVEYAWKKIRLAKEEQMSKSGAAFLRP